jgi:hypothetical protein
VAKYPQMGTFPTTSQLGTLLDENTGFTNLWLEGLAPIATTLRDDIAAGWLTTMVELAHADTYAGYLEMAEGLHGRGFKDAAAVIAGTSLEIQVTMATTTRQP